MLISLKNFLFESRTVRGLDAHACKSFNYRYCMCESPLCLPKVGALPPHLSHLPYDELQFTLVDCPGHASLIKTIIGGVRIIDMMMLVIDVTKGLQAQTAECLVCVYSCFIHQERAEAMSYSLDLADITILRGPGGK